MTSELVTSSTKEDCRRHSALYVFGHNTVWLWLDRGALRIGTVIAGLLLVRYLGPYDYGVYATVLSVGALANVVADFGLTRYAARAVAVDDGETRVILAANLLATVGTAVLEAAVGGIAAIRGEWYVALICLGLFITNLEGTATLCSSVLTAELRAASVLPASVLGMLGTVLVIGVVIWWRLSVLALLIGIAVKSVATVTLRLCQLRRHWPQLHDYNLRRLVRLIRCDAWPFFSYSLAQVGYEKIAIICFSLVAAQQQVGWLAAAVTISGVFPQWTFAAAQALVPVMTKLFESERLAEFSDLQQRLVDVALFLSVPISVAMAVFAPQIAGFLGHSFSDSAAVLRIVAYRVLLTIIEGFLGGALLTAVNRTNERSNALLRGVVLLGVLTLVLGRRYGAIGAAWAMILSDVFVLLQYVRIFSAVRLNLRWPALWASVLGGAAMALIGLLSPVSWEYRLAPAVVGYLSVLFMISRHRLLGAVRTVRECWTGSPNGASL